MHIDDTVFKKSAYLYGSTETKAHTELWLKQWYNRSYLNKYKFHVHPELCARNLPSKYKVPIRFHSNPDTLVVLAQVVVNQIALPLAFTWTRMDVVEWIDKLGFPQYRNTFERNWINGHTLIFVNASVLSAMNIKTYSHVKIITKAINKLYEIEYVNSRYPLKFLRLYNGFIGPKYQLTKPTDLFRKMKMLRNLPKYEEHWQILEKWPIHNKPVESESIAYKYRLNLYKAKKEQCRIKAKEKIEIGDIFSLMASPSGELKRPYVLNYLYDHDSLYVHAKKQHPEDIEYRGCLCELCCQCTWGATDYTKPRTLQLLRKQLYKKYEIIESQYLQLHLRDSAHRPSSLSHKSSIY